MTSEDAVIYKAARDDFANNRTSVEQQRTSRKICCGKMERLSDDELKARKERAMDKLRRYRRWKTSRERMIQHIRLLEEYLETIPASQIYD